MRPVNDYLRGLASKERPGLLGLSLALLTLAWHLWFFALAPRTPSGDVPREALMLAGANDQRLVLAGEVWRLLASTFLHADTSHLVTNLLGLVLFASLAEVCFGWQMGCVLYIFSGIVSSISSIWASDTPSVGASGAVFGLVGAVTVFALTRLRHALRPAARYVSATVVLVTLFFLAYDTGGDSIDPAAHLGGLLAGALTGLLIGRAMPKALKVFLTLTAIAACVTALTFSALSLSMRLAMPMPPFSRVELPGVVLPWPQTWATMDPCTRKAIACAHDSYGAVLIAGPAGELLQGRTYDPLMTVASGLIHPLKTTDGDTLRFEVPLNRDQALLLLVPTWLAPRYEPMLSQILSGVSFLGDMQKSGARYKQDTTAP